MIYLASVCFFLSLLPATIGVNAQESTNASSFCRSNTLFVPPAAFRHRLKGPRLIIAHRGASAHLPEHTLAAYRLALELGADYIEPDVVATADGGLIAMHTVDLNITTNVVEVFGSTRQPWFSPFAGRNGYWTFNFTLAEIQQLRVKQRLPDARTTMYDGLFTVPTLLEILELLNHWNTVDLPQYLDLANAATAEINSDTLIQLARSGMYPELKEVVWLQQEANLDLVQLIFQHFQDYKDQWTTSLLLPSDCQPLKFDQYKVPGVIVQSFDGASLQYFSQTWKSSTWYKLVPEPPYILLVPHPTCWNDDFWFTLGDTWRSTIQGLGCDKNCLLSETEGKFFLDKAEEFNMALHPYTARPEQVYVQYTPPASTSSSMTDTSSLTAAESSSSITTIVPATDLKAAAVEGMASGGELTELRFLFCQRHIHGIFDESVSNSILVAASGCEDNLTTTTSPLAGGESSVGQLDNQNGTGSLTSGLCYSTESKDTLYVGLASFVMGVALTLFLILWNTRSPAPRRRRRGLQRQAVPTEDSTEGEGYPENDDRIHDEEADDPRVMT